MSKSESTKHQEYTYSFKSAAYANQSSSGSDLCTEKVLFYLIPPQDAISIQYLRTHLIIEFDSGVPAASRILESIGIADEFNYIDEQVDYLRILPIGQAADANRRVELDINLTPLLNKDNIAYSTELSILGNGYTFVYLKFPDALAANLSVGRIILWKVDALFTTKGIR